MSRKNKYLFKIDMNTKAYVNKYQNRFIDELIELLKIPSVSADSSHLKDIEVALKMVTE